MEFITDVLLVLCISFLAYCVVSTTMWHLWERKCKRLEQTKEILRARLKEQAEELDEYRRHSIVCEAFRYGASKGDK